MNKLTAMIKETKAIPHSIEKGTIQKPIPAQSVAVYETKAAASRMD